MSESPEVAIYATITSEYTWQGEVSDLPPGLHKGVVVKGEVDLDRLNENMENFDEVALQKFIELNSEEFTINDTEEC